MKKTITAIALLTTIASASDYTMCKSIDNMIISKMDEISKAFRLKPTAENALSTIRKVESIQTITRFGIHNCKVDDRKKELYIKLIDKYEISVNNMKKFLK